MIRFLANRNLKRRYYVMWNDSVPWMFWFSYYRVSYYIETILVISVFSSIKATSSRRRIPTSIGISLTLTLCVSLTLSLFNLSVAWKCTPCPVVPFVFLYLVTVKNMDDDQILNCWKFTYTNQLHCMYVRYHNLSKVVNLFMSSFSHYNEVKLYTASHLRYKLMCFYLILKLHCENKLQWLFSVVCCLIT